MRRRLLASVFGLLGLSACGGGGGGGSSPPPASPPPPAAQFSVLPATLNFGAANPAAGRPAAQNVTGSVSGTISGMTLYILVEAGGPVFDQISNVVISGSTGQATVTPVHPLFLGTGSYAGTLTVRACVDSPTCATGQLAGSPRVINVSYNIGSSVQQDAVMPRVVPADTDGQVILRGTGLGTVTSVSFGGGPGSNIDVRSNTEIAVTYPALTPGSYAVSLNNGAVPFTGTLVTVADPAYAEAVLSYPAAPNEIGNVLYDAERQAVLVVFEYEDLNNASANNHILRYTYNGSGWDQDTSGSFGRLRDLALNNRGDRLLALAEYGLYELDPASLASQLSTTNFELLNASNGYMRTLATSNDGYVFISSALRGSGIVQAYLYSQSAPTRAFVNMEHRSGSVLLGTSATIGRLAPSGTQSSGDGSRIAIVNGDSASLEYSAGGGTLLPSSLAFSQSYTNYRASLDLTGSRLIVSNGVETGVYEPDNSLFCALPGDTRAYVVNPAGSRGYVVDISSNLRVFDLTTDTNGGPCQQVGVDVPIFDVGVDPTGFGFPDSLIRMTTTPDGQTLFIAGPNGLLVEPVPY